MKHLLSEILISNYEKWGGANTTGYISIIREQEATSCGSPMLVSLCENGKDIPATRYTRTIASSKSRQTQMGLVHITTDEGVDVIHHLFINKLSSVHPETVVSE